MCFPRDHTARKENKDKNLGYPTSRPGTEETLTVTFLCPVLACPGVTQRGLSWARARILA